MHWKNSLKQGQLKANETHSIWLLMKFRRRAGFDLDVCGMFREGLYP